MVKWLVGAVFAVILAVPALICAESWPGLNYDASGRNSSRVDVSATPSVRWFHTFERFNSAQLGAQRSNNLSIRDGKVLVIVPPLTPPKQVAVPGAPYTQGAAATFGLFDLETGELERTLVTIHQGGSGYITPKGTMDSDQQVGLVNHFWRQDGVVVSMHGSDPSLLASWTVADGYIFPAGATAPSSHCPDLGSPTNSTGYIQISETNPELMVLCNGGHSTMGTCRWRYLSQPYRDGSLGPALSKNGPALVSGEAVYTLNVVNKLSSTDGGYGTRITHFNVHGGVAANLGAYLNPDVSVLTLGQHHMKGAPRAWALGESSLYFFGYQTKGAGTSQAPDLSRGRILVGLTGNKESLRIELPSAASVLTRPSYSAMGWFVPQMAVSEPYVAVFQPQTKNNLVDTPGELYIVDSVTGTLVQHVVFPAGSFESNTVLAFPQNGPATEQAVQLVWAGSAAHIVEARTLADGVGLRVLRVSPGTDEIAEAVLPLHIPAKGVLALREVAAVDGRLVVLVDNGMYDQILVGLE